MTAKNCCKEKMCSSSKFPLSVSHLIGLIDLDDLQDLLTLSDTTSTSVTR